MSMTIAPVTTDLAYIKERLLSIGSSQWGPIHKATRINLRTIRRIASGETPAPRSDTVGKIAIYFRTKEKRGR